MKSVFNNRKSGEGRRRLALFSIRKGLTAWAFGFAAVMFLSGFAVWPSQLAFTVTKESGQLAYAVPIRPGDTFTIRYIHSVHRTPVEEHFRISGQGELILERIVYESYGVGNPSGPGPGERFYIRDSRFIIEGMDRRRKTLHLRIGQTIANHELVMGGLGMPFAMWSDPGSKVVLEVKRVSRWSLWNR